MDLNKPVSLNDFDFVDNPARGSAVLTINAGNQVLGRLIFKALPWHKTGIQPFYYKINSRFDFSSEEFMFSITVVLSRKSTVYFASIQPGFRAPIQLYRIQNDHLLPDPESEFIEHDVMAPPVPWWADHPTLIDDSFAWVQWQFSKESNFSAADYAGWQKEYPLLKVPGWMATVVTQPLGVTFSDDGGLWELSISVSEDEPEAFAYEIHFPADKSDQAFCIRIACTKKVKVECKIVLDPETPTQLFVEWDNLLKIDQVPPQGSLLGERFAWVKLDDSHIDFVPTEKLQSRINVAEFLIQLHPITALIYDAASLAYMLASGKNLSGHKLSATEKHVMGGIALISAAFDFAGPIKKAVGLLTKRSPVLKKVIEKPVLDAIKSHAPERVIDAVKAASSKQRDALAGAIEDLAKGKIQASQLNAQVNELLTKHLKAQQYNSKIVFKTMSADRLGFCKAELDMGYYKYITRRANEAKDAIGWALSQRAGSRYIAILEREFGENWSAVLKEIRRNHAAASVNQRTLAVLEKFFERPDVYDDLVKETNGLRGLVEADHLVEKRFMDTVITDGGFDKGLLLAQAVPLNPAVARQLPPYLVKYVHTQKTSMMKSLIPHGAEDLFKMQDWQDATTHVLKRLGMSDEYIARHVFEDFAQLASHAVPTQKLIRRLNPDLTRIKQIRDSILRVQKIPTSSVF